MFCMTHVSTDPSLWVETPGERFKMLGSTKSEKSSTFTKYGSGVAQEKSTWCQFDEELKRVFICIAIIYRKI